MAALTVLSLGWGVQSWTIAAMVALRELPPIDYAIFADTTHEHAGTYAHAAKWTPWLEDHGVRVVTVQGKRTNAVREYWSNSVLIPAFTMNRQGGPGQVRRQCTHGWKIVPIRAFLRPLVPQRPGAVEMWMGISLDEWQRMRTSDVKYIVHVYPLVDRRMTREACIAWLQARGLDVPPKSACTFCPFTSLSRWQALKRSGGADWEEAVATDEAVRSKRPGFDLYIHPARRPLEEAVSIPEDQGAHQLELELPCDSGHCFV